MHILHLLRHAQSADKQPGQTDWQRILKREGEEEAKRIGIFLKDRRQIPDLVLTSTAQRAHQTATIVCHQTGYSTVLVKKYDALYEATATEFITIIHEIPSQVQRVLMVAHNPGISWLVEILSGQEVELRPCEMATLEFDVSWPDISNHSGRLKELIHAFTLI